MSGNDPVTQYLVDFYGTRVGQEIKQAARDRWLEVHARKQAEEALEAFRRESGIPAWGWRILDFFSRFVRV